MCVCIDVDWSDTFSGRYYIIASDCVCYIFVPVINWPCQLCSLCIYICDAWLRECWVWSLVLKIYEDICKNPFVWVFFSSSSFHSVGSKVGLQHNPAICCLLWLSAYVVCSMVGSLYRIHILSDKCLSCHAAVLCMWAVSLMGYNTNINDPTVSGCLQLSGKIMSYGFRGHHSDTPFNSSRH